MQTKYDIEWQEMRTSLALRINHADAGGMALYRFMHPINDREMLRLIVAQEPAGPKGSLLWHASVSIGNANGDPEPLRKPSADELMSSVVKAARVSRVHLGTHETSDDGLVCHIWE